MNDTAQNPSKLPPLPWPFNLEAWPLAQAFVVQKVLATGARVRADAYGELCSSCGSVHQGAAENTTYFSPDGVVWPLCICNGCRASFRNDFEAAGKRLIERVLTRFNTIGTGSAA